MDKFWAKVREEKNKGESFWTLPFYREGRRPIAEQKMFCTTMYYQLLAIKGRRPFFSCSLPMVLLVEMNPLNRQGASWGDTHPWQSLRFARRTAEELTPRITRRIE